MNDPSSPSNGSIWLSRSVVVLLALQVGLLWTHGSMLQRQHDDIQALREDVQAMAESLDDQDEWDSSQGDPGASPARARVAHRRWPVRSAGRRIPIPADLRARAAVQASTGKVEAELAGRADAPWRPWLWSVPAAGLVLLAGCLGLGRRT
jgi:hypothetical protein